MTLRTNGAFTSITMIGSTCHGRGALEAIEVEGCDVHLARILKSVMPCSGTLKNTPKLALKALNLDLTEEALCMDLSCVTEFKQRPVPPNATSTLILRSW